MKLNTLIIWTLFAVPLVGFSQNEGATLSKKEQRKNRPAYTGITMGVSYSNFRDLATSPLIYSGGQIHFGLSTLKLDRQREAENGFSYTFGNYASTFNDHSAISTVKTFSFYYSQLYEFKKLSSEKLNVKIGGLFNATGNIRINESLENNGFGFEMFPTLFGSIKVTKGISRTVDKQKKFLFIKYTLKQKTRDLAFRLNVGLVNSTYRNGFVYSGQSDILNEATVLDHYQFKVFSGFRMGTVLDYTVSLKNKNKMQFSYIWDAYRTGGDLDRFEMAHHILKLTFLFNTNNR